MAPWVEPLVEFLKEHTPKAYLVWVMFGVGEKAELEAVNKPETGSFVIDYFDPGDWLNRYLRKLEDRGQEVGREDRLMGAILKPANNFDALIACLRSIAG